MSNLFADRADGRSDALIDLAKPVGSEAYESTPILEDPTGLATETDEIQRNGAAMVVATIRSTEA